MSVFRLFVRSRSMVVALVALAVAAGGTNAYAAAKNFGTKCL